jgi:hypothetical protein
MRRLLLSRLRVATAPVTSLGRIGFVRLVCVLTIGAMVGGLLAVRAATPAFAAAPTITSISPAFGTWQGGVAVTITGTGFTTTADTTVRFGSVPAPDVAVVNATTITARSPDAGDTGAGTSVPVTVTNSGGSSNAISAGPPATWVSGSTTLTGPFVSADIGQTVNGGTGLPANAVITSIVPNASATINAPTTAAQTTAVAVSLTLSFTYSRCTFNKQIAGVVLRVTPGTTSLAISCSRLQGDATFVPGLFSPLAGVMVDTPFRVRAAESLSMNNAPDLPPAPSSDNSGNLTVVLPVPAKTTGGNPADSPTDSDATCPPSQNQVNQGLLTCVLEVGTLTGVNMGSAAVEYPGQLGPQTPTLALSPTGSSTTTVTATGEGWWGGGPASNTIPAANIRIGCVGTNPCTGGRPAVSSTLTITGPSYLISCTPTTCTGTLTPSRLSGTFVKPWGASGTVAIDQLTTRPIPCSAPANCFPGNGPGGTTVEATASSALPAATATGARLSTWGSNVPNNAISNSGDNPNPNQAWLPAAGVDSTGSLTYQVDLPAPTTLSAVTENWYAGFAAPTGYTVDTSADGVTWTTQVTISANTLNTRTDVFPGGLVTASHIRLHAITGFASTACRGCGFAGIALVKFGWDGHGVAFPQATSPNTTPWRVGSKTTPQFGAPVITTLGAVGVGGATLYGYEVTAVNGNGETQASTEQTIAAGNATLSPTNFIDLAWTPVNGAVSYNVYGRSPGAETFLANVPATATTCAPDPTPVPPCFSDTGGAVTGALPPAAGTVESNALNNPGADPAFFWQPTAAAAAGASYEVDLGPSTTVDSVTPTWSAGFSPPVAYEIDTSTNGVTWTAQFQTTTNTSRTATDVFPGGQVTASYLRLVINTPFPATCTGCGSAGLVLNQLSWNGAAATPTATPPASSLTPQGYYPATLPNSLTRNTTSTWNNQTPNNGFFGGPGGRIVVGGGLTSGSRTINAAAAIFAPTDVGRPIRGAGVGLGAVVTAFNSATSITVSVPSTSNASGVVLQLGGASWWQPAGAPGNIGTLTYAVDVGTPRTTTNVTASWLNGQFCPGHGTCTGFQPISYQIFTSPNGTQNSWTPCATVTANASFTTSDACAATGVVSIEFLITSWNATTPFDGYGPALNSLLIT